MASDDKSIKLNSDERDERNKITGAFARPPKGSRARKKQDEVMKRLWNKPEMRAKLKEMHKQYKATLDAQQASGAGYASDKILRELQLEYNGRLTVHGATALPASYNIAEAFFARQTEFAGLVLLPEEDYLVSFTDFLDYVTSPDGPSLDIGAAVSLAPNRIINVNSLDVPGDLLLETDNGHSFAILGASYVRRGDEIAMLLAVGEHFPPDDLQALEDLIHVPIMPMPHKREIQPAENLEAGVVFVDEEKTLVRDIALCRFNLKEKHLEARCLLQDVGRSYRVRSDVPETLRPYKDAETRAIKMGEELDKVSVVWESAKMLLLLPAYLNARVMLQRVEQRTTQLGLQMKNSLKFKRSVAQALPEAKVVFRRIAAIRVENPSTPQQITGRSYTPPAFQVPVAGFWRTLPDPTQTGHDEEGHLTQGRTWVHGHIRHKDKSAAPGPKVIYIKSSLALARRKLEQYRAQTAQGAQSVPARAEPANAAGRPMPQPPIAAADTLAGAYVYVLRCPAHGRDIYKVGYTDRDPEQRAQELSRKTATPTPFLVVQAWAVSDGRYAEQAVHRALESYRLDTNREFFQATYAALRQALEVAIQPWAL